MLQDQPQRRLERDAFQVDDHRRVRRRSASSSPWDRRRSAAGCRPASTVADLMYLSTSARGVGLAKDIVNGSSSPLRRGSFLGLSASLARQHRGQVRDRRGGSGIPRPTPSSQAAASLHRHRRSRLCRASPSRPCRAGPGLVRLLSQHPTLRRRSPSSGRARGDGTRWRPWPSSDRAACRRRSAASERAFVDCRPARRLGMRRTPGRH